ncbi:MAG: CinA family protein [Lachnospiraceae bacterium]|nr:CinA family protein [Lachnospiraceae bacterium]
MNIQEIVNYLIENKITISTAESITGGLISKLITDVPGSSNILSESFVVYSNEAKVKVLGVDKKLIDEFGVVSMEVAKDTALKLHKATGSSLCVSTTGNAGPSVLEDKSVGLVYIGIYYNGEVMGYKFKFDGDRDKVRNDTASKAFELIKENLK